MKEVVSLSNEISDLNSQITILEDEVSSLTSQLDFANYQIILLNHLWIFKR
ncbi:MAG: hypothetical protein CM15mP23_18540 [Cryomorphaceae bacterium]|nr:MAG: hypothetical protein CM15mP23_18540 [Cryomorphaceae bacterium]